MVTHVSPFLSLTLFAFDWGHSSSVFRSVHIYEDFSNMSGCMRSFSQYSSKHYALGHKHTYSPIFACMRVHSTPTHTYMLNDPSTSDRVACIVWRDACWIYCRRKVKEHEQGDNKSRKKRTKICETTMSISSCNSQKMSCILRVSRHVWMLLSLVSACGTIDEFFSQFPCCWLLSTINESTRID